MSRKREHISLDSRLRGNDVGDWKAPLIRGGGGVNSYWNYLRQKAGVNTISKVKISRRPSSIEAHSSHLL